MKRNKTTKTQHYVYCIAPCGILRHHTRTVNSNYVKNLAIKFYLIITILNVSIGMYFYTSDCSGDGCIGNLIGLVYSILWTLCNFPILLLNIKAFQNRLHKIIIVFSLPSFIITIIGFSLIWTDIWDLFPFAILPNLIFSITCGLIFWVLVKKAVNT